MKNKPDKTNAFIRQLNEFKVTEYETLWGLVKWEKRVKVRTVSEDIYLMLDEERKIDKVVIKNGDIIYTFNL